MGVSSEGFPHPISLASLALRFKRAPAWNSCLDRAFNAGVDVWVGHLPYGHQLALGSAFSTQMAYLVQKVTGLFLTGDAHWVKETENAKEIATTLSVLAFATPKCRGGSRPERVDAPALRIQARSTKWAVGVVYGLSGNAG